MESPNPGSSTGIELHSVPSVVITADFDTQTSPSPSNSKPSNPSPAPSLRRPSPLSSLLNVFSSRSINVRNVVGRSQSTPPKPHSGPDHGSKLLNTFSQKSVNTGGRGRKESKQKFIPGVRQISAIRRNSEVYEEAMEAFKLGGSLAPCHSAVGVSDIDVWDVATKLEVRKQYLQRCLLWLTMFVCFVVPWLLAFEESGGEFARYSVLVADFAFFLNLLNDLREYNILSHTSDMFNQSFLYSWLPVVIGQSLFNCMPFVLLMKTAYGRIDPRTVMGVLFLLQCPTRLHTCTRSSTFIYVAPHSTKSTTVIFQLIKTVFAMFMLLHMACSSWIVIVNANCADFLAILRKMPYDQAMDEIANSHQQFNRCWFNNNPEYDQSLQAMHDHGNVEVYFKTLFLTTSMVIGSENISPGTRNEAIFGTGCLIIGVAFTAIFFGQTMSLIHSLNGRTLEFREKLENIRDIMEHISLPHKVRDKVNRYFWYKHSNYAYQGIRHFLEELSEPLAMEIQLACHSTVIGGIPLFQDCGPNVIRMVLLCIKPEIFLPGDLIFRMGDEADKLYMIQNGEVEIISGTGEILVILEAGNYFGEVALLTDIHRTASARSSSYSTCDTLSKASFDTIRHKYTEFNEKIKAICEAKEYVFDTHTDYGEMGREQRQKGGALGKLTAEQLANVNINLKEKIAKRKAQVAYRGSMNSRKTESSGEIRDLVENPMAAANSAANDLAIASSKKKPARVSVGFGKSKAIDNSDNSTGNGSGKSTLTEDAQVRAIVREEIEELKVWLQKALHQQHLEREQMLSHSKPRLSILGRSKKGLAPSRENNMSTASEVSAASSASTATQSESND